MQGRIHSIESMSTVDGPGLRTVVFFQGCPMRCKYCHNPDTWQTAQGEIFDVPTLAARLVRGNRNFGTTGGDTLTGGEPLMQAQFALELTRALHTQGVHVALDTSGCIVTDAARQLLDEVDLVILDIKHAQPKGFCDISGHSMEPLLTNLDRLRLTQRPILLRQVIVPGLTDDPAQIDQLAMVAAGLNLRKLELLPYHTLGVHKWAQLGMAYPLEGVPPMDKEGVRALTERFMKLYEGRPELG